MDEIRNNIGDRIFSWPYRFMVNVVGVIYTLIQLARTGKVRPKGYGFVLTDRESAESGAKVFAYRYVNYFQRHPRLYNFLWFTTSVTGWSLIGIFIIKLIFRHG